MQNKIKQTGICPVCNGSGRVPVPEDQQRFKTIRAGYDATTDTFDCTNCGGQYQWPKPSGQVPLTRDGEPCTHSYTGQTVGRCLTRYTCEHCGDSYHIDSGD